MTDLLEVLILTAGVFGPLALLVVAVFIADRSYDMKTRIPLLDVADPGTEEIVSRARQRANQDRQTPTMVPVDEQQQLDVLRGAWCAARSVDDPHRRDRFRRHVEARAQQYRTAA